MTATLRITLLGSPTVTLDGLPVRGFVSSKAAALLYYLAASGRAHTRAGLAGLLWPETSDAQARKNLRDVLSNLRRLLGPYLAINVQDVALRVEALAGVDCRQFAVEAGARADIAALQAAVARYGGSFLDGFSPAGALPFEEWAHSERERLQQLALAALQQLADQAARQGDPGAGVDYAMRALAIDPLREEAHRQLMLLLALSGQRGAALAQYAVCRRLLQDELGVDPDQASETLYRGILDGEVGPPIASSLSSPQYQLPAARTTVVGRAVETARVLALLGDPTTRLVTLTGPGGVGKTTLALHVARQLAADRKRGVGFAHGVAFTALAAIDVSGTAQPDDDSVPLVATRVAEALGLILAAGASPNVQLGLYLRDKALLLVLDNCERLLGIDRLIVELLEQAPQLCVLATSRGRINVGGERVIELGGLACPADAVAPARALDYAAVALFQRTAEAAKPGLSWSAGTADAAAMICRLVGGLPLAIDLAASQARLMPVAEIARELAAGVKLLASTRRDLPERHRSLRAVFDHSWRLLGPEEQRALGELAIFQGGFTRAAAVQIAGAHLAVLATLVDNSLLRQLPASEETGRYDLLDIVRQFAAEHLDAQAARAPAAARHGRYYLALLGRCGAQLRRSGQQQAAAEIAGEIDNLRAAWRWAVDQGQAELLAAAAEALFLFYEMRGWFREGAELFAQALASPGLQPERAGLDLVGGLLAYAGWCAFQLGQQHEGRALLAESLTLLRAVSGAAVLVPALTYSAACAYYSGDYAEAKRLADEALELSRQRDDQHGASVALTVLGQIATLIGRYDEARHMSEASLAIERKHGNRWGMVFPLISLGRSAQAQGNHREAQRHFQEGLAIRVAVNDRRGIALCLRFLGDTALALDDHAEAAWCYREALAMFRDIGSQEGMVAAFTGLSDAALARGDVTQARAAFGEALAVARETDSAPRLLDVAAGAAAILVASDPTGAVRLAARVYGHPAATQRSRDRAALVLARAGVKLPEAIPNSTDDALDALLNELDRLTSPV